ncbi:MAG: WD40 repeat domain-containing protein, partial [Promethearchaeota archaeon]
DNSIKLWNVSSRKEIQIIRNYVEDVNSIAFSPTGDAFASCSDDETIKLYYFSSILDLLDFDGDGMDDSWERQYGFNPNSLEDKF